MRHRPISVIPIFLVTLSLLAPVRRAEATSVAPLPLEELVRQSDAIVLARVQSTRAYWQDRRIVTRVRLAVEAAMKGHAPPTVELVVSGGKVGDIAMRVLGGAEFRERERAIVFLSRAGELYRVVGLAQGKLGVGPGPNAQDVVRWTGAEVALPVALERLRALAARGSR